MNGPDPHRATLEVYERRGGEWVRRRSPTMAGAERFAKRLAEDASLPDAAVVDLGCGPGWHLPSFPTGTIALDGAASMLAQVPNHAPHAARVQADLRALPLRRGSLRAAWAQNSYVHLGRGSVPMAMWDLHRSMAVGAVARLLLFGGNQEHHHLEGDDFEGRAFSLWPEDLLVDVIGGAGFALESIERTEPANADELPTMAVTIRRERTLADTVGPGMRLLLVGLNPSLHAADSGVGFSGPSNRGWPALLESGLATVDRDPVALLRDHRIGMTDLVKRSTARASELDDSEYGDGLGRLERLCRWLQPGAVCMVGLSGWRAAVDRKASAGAQEKTIGGRPVWVMGNPSGLNAHVTTQDLAESLLEAAALGDQAR
ncbi:MAG: hypothetical protein GY812_01445 [Actinomycetia bacterium]|nr:hypothetical protein [Actinomycetes bacterium]